VSRQFKNGTCSCWKKVDANLGEKGTRLERLFSIGDHQYLAIATERMDGKRSPPRRIVASFCPFCGSKLKDQKR
jgi:hypothetical protein